VHTAGGDDGPLRVLDRFEAMDRKVLGDSPQRE
jgi:hypothetical protein